MGIRIFGTAKGTHKLWCCRRRDRRQARLPRSLAFYLRVPSSGNKNPDTLMGIRIFGTAKGTRNTKESLRPAVASGARPRRISLFESKRTNKNRKHRMVFPVFGTAKGTRTPDLLIRSQSLYPTELSPHMYSWELPGLGETKQEVRSYFLPWYGERDSNPRPTDS